MEYVAYRDFRGFIDEAKKISEWRLIEGADWDNEIGALIEATAELDFRPMLLFDKIKGHPAGFRLVSLAFANYKRTALAFGISPEKNKLEVVRLLARKMKSAKSIPPAEVKTSPLMESVLEGEAVDLFKFPAPRFHDGDGGRYIVVVDEDIDATNLKEVLWAMMTRVDPPTNIDIVDGCWSTPLDPRMPPEKKDSKDHTNGRAVFYAVRPFEWKNKFPKVSRSSRELRERVIQKFRGVIPFPGS